MFGLSTTRPKWQKTNSCIIGAPASTTLTLAHRIAIRGCMEPGNIIEYIDRQKIICAVILNLKNNKAHLLNELNREVSLSVHRVLHVGDQLLAPGLSRDQQVAALKDISSHQSDLANMVDIQSLWELLHTDPEWVDVPVITNLCFPDGSTSVHEAAVIRALFENRRFFKFDRTRFLPYTPDQVALMSEQARKAHHMEQLIFYGAECLNRIQRGKPPLTDENHAQLVEIFKSAFVFEKESPYFQTFKKILSKANISQTQDIFNLLVKLKIFDKNENIDLLRHRIPVDFAKQTDAHAAGIPDFVVADAGRRKDLTGLDLVTIDGPGTRDFDDAISIRDLGDHLSLGIHIADVAHFIPKDDLLDKAALKRGSSIYTPDLKIPMLPACLTEHRCSLTAGDPKPAISLMVRLTPSMKIIDFDICASIINVRRQLSYADADLLCETAPDLMLLYKIARNFRNRRLEQGAVHISLPEIHFHNQNENGIQLLFVDRESPGRLLVAEMMILTNWLFARHLHDHKVPAIFRSQPDPKDRLYRGEEGTLFQNYMQRRHLARFVLGTAAEHHSGLGLDAYVTATSPIRKYFDLVTQRQIRSTLGLEPAYAADDIQQVISRLQAPLATIGRIQGRRNRYWILKHLQQKTGEQAEAIIIQKRRNNYQILLPKFMIECLLPAPGNIKLKPEDLIHVKIQHVDPRKDLISVFMA